MADQVTPLRLAGHLSVLAVAAVILIMSQVKMPALNIPMSAFKGAQEISGVGQRTGTKVGVANTSEENASLQRSVIANTVTSDRAAPQAVSGPRQDIQLYTVHSGDTVLAIAAKYGLNPETILWANNAIEQDPDKLSIGDQLNILPINGVLHIVKPGDTLSSLADKYKVSLSDITGYKANNLADSASALTVWSQLVIPGGTKVFVQPQYANVATTSDTPDNATKGAGSFSWPTSGEISQKYWSGHPAVDISSWTGNPVKAADSGYVALASSGGSWNTGYGNYIIIDHGNGFTTLYAHLSSVFVKPGENVARGEQIGLVGNTGHSTGPHLHFEIRYQGVQRNPSTYLP
ncbi:MAG: LysM peptidoglycan-binding domain-containing M23 family metallopeptidase [Chloroflexi bacterium]|nr:LysM peptidoglycan-binding domain-containing M23 family metallopeptidase [Chloroflexota bacterium]